MDIKMPIMRYHGGKYALAPWIIEHFPAHRVYVEPFGGAAGVMLRKHPSAVEIYNDIDSRVSGLFQVLRDETSALELNTLLSLTPYSRHEFNLSKEPSECLVEQARRTLVRSWFQHTATDQGSGMRTFSRQNGKSGAIPAHSWRRLQEMIPIFQERFSKVLVEDLPASKVIAHHDGLDTLLYVDPPYLASTRKCGERGIYSHEMTESDHVALLGQLCNGKGMVLLSGYPSALYQDALADWTLYEHQTSKSSNRGSSPATECLWINPAAQSARGFFS